MTRKLLLVPLALLAACAFDSTTPDPTVLHGDWAYEAGPLQVEGQSCCVHGVRLRLTETGETFIGTASSGTISCTGPAGMQTHTWEASEVYEGRRSGGRVSFGLVGDDIQHEGVLAGGRVTGTVRIAIDDDGTTVTGPFTLKRD